MTISPTRRTRPSGAGFTLVELMVVVAIVGILSVLAVVGYRKLISSSRTTEAMHMVQAIRLAQESYHAETGTYANVSKALAYDASGTLTNGSDLYPQVIGGKTPGNFKTAWGAPGSCVSAGACNAGADWSVLPVHVDGPVMFGYSTIAGAAGTAPATPGLKIQNQTISWSNSSTDWYLISAVGDTDANGTYCTVIGSSYSNDLMVNNDGE